MVTAPAGIVHNSLRTHLALGHGLEEEAVKRLMRRFEEEWTDTEASMEEDRFWNTPIEWDETVVEGSPREKVKAPEEHSKEVQNLWDAIRLLKQGEEDRKELLKGAMLTIDELVDNQDTLKATFDEFSERIAQREESKEAAPEEPPEEEEPTTIHVVLSDDVDGRDDGAEEKLRVSDEVLDQVSKQVMDSITEDLGPWRKKLYTEVRDEIRDHLSALRTSDNALNLRLIKIGDSLESMASRVDALATEEAPPREVPKVEVEAKSELEPPEETLKDVVLVCDHGGKRRNRTGFTERDRTEGVVFCPQCGRRLTYR